MHRRNKYLRIKFIQTVEDNGIRYNWISERLNIPISTLNNWKQGKANMSAERLDIVEAFLKRYDYLDTYKGD